MSLCDELKVHFLLVSNCFIEKSLVVDILKKMTLKEKNLNFTWTFYCFAIGKVGTAIC